MFNEPTQHRTDTTASAAPASVLIRLEPLGSARRCRDSHPWEQTVGCLAFPGTVIALTVLERAHLTSAQLGFMVVAVAVLGSTALLAGRWADQEAWGDISAASERGTDKWSTRLVCRGHPNDLRWFRTLGTEMFEPYIVAARFGWWDRHPLCRFLCGVVILSVGLRVMSSAWSPIAIVAPVYYAYDVDRFLRPCYYRVVPGRLELMKYRFLNQGVPQIHTIRLDRARIVCDLAERFIEIMPMDGVSEQSLIPLEGQPQPRAFAQMVFRAAVCSASAPPLPTTELLG